MKKILLLLLLGFLCTGCVHAPIQKVKQKNVKEQQNIEQSNLIMRDTCSKMQKDALQEHLKADYDQLFATLKMKESSVELSCTSDECATIFDAVLFDHPELFWVSNQYSYRDTGKNRTVMYPKYTYTDKQAQDLQKQLDAVTEPILTTAEQLSTDYEKVKYIYDTIIDTTSYVNKEKNNQNLLSSLLDKEAVCAGYSKSMKYLLDKLHIPNEIIVVKVLKDPNEFHVINLVMMDHAYYYMDPTFGDTKVERAFAKYRYAYFAMTSDEMLSLYKPMQEYKLTDAYQDNYFYQEHVYLDRYDENKLVQIIKKNLDNADTSLYLKCKNKEIYEQVKTTLASQQGFKLFQKAGYQPKTLQYYNLDENYCFFVKYK